MPAINFQSRFAAALRAGTKRQTIRAERKRPIQVGDTLHFFNGQRQRGGGERLGVARCTEVSTVVLAHWDEAELTVILNGKRLSANQRRCLALHDGFDCVTDFRDFFRPAAGNQPFHGVLIRW